ncbi:MAG: amylo-alpha-1,6-glucosidase [Nitrospirae bacterium]|nr:MAG: amylo-alpha-1,6-glucosidase [Nitrospirota bacterium]
MDIKTFGLKEGDLFLILNPFGDISPTAVSPHQGLYRDDTRFLSRWELRVNGQVPHLLSSTVKSDNLLFTADLTNPLISDEGRTLRKDNVHIFRSAFLLDNTFFGKIRLMNYDRHEISFSLELTFDADFYDIFELRGAKRQKRGKTLPPSIENRAITFQYNGLDGIKRFTRISFEDIPDRITKNKAIFKITLPPKSPYEIIFQISAELHRTKGTVNFDDAYKRAHQIRQEEESGIVKITTSNEHFNELLHRSRSDICTMLTRTEHGNYYYAGIPWYCTTFGRDGLITALQCLWIAPQNALGVLSFLAANQAKDLDPENDAEPGKIPHEMRFGEMARTEEVPFRRYYGTVDATPLFVVLAGEYLKRTGNIQAVEVLWDNLRSAFQWLTDFGDADGDCFIEYSRKRSDGLINQGWKDSFDSIFHADGSLASGPIALIEVQGYAYLGFIHLAHMAKLLGDQEVANSANRRARELKKRFHRAFWSKKLNFYGVALDGQKRLCEVKTSNPGQALFSGLISPRYSKIVARKLLDSTFFSGWGIRTVAKDEVLYNPMSYHNGSVWPHDNSLIGWGLQRYDLKEEILKILSGLFDASLFVDLKRLPELFCGFDRREDEGPTLYPVACQPQAWASGSVFLLLQAALGLEFEHQSHSIIFKSPKLPEYIDWILVEGIGLKEGKANLLLERYKDDVVVKVLEKEGDINVVIYK